jgi:uncharacterized protein YegP (UPF0339 family)
VTENARIHFVIISNAAGQYVWLLKDASGVVVAQSRPYPSKKDAIDSIETVKVSLPGAQVFDSVR